MPKMIPSYVVLSAVAYLMVPLSVATAAEEIVQTETHQQQSAQFNEETGDVAVQENVTVIEQQVAHGAEVTNNVTQENEVLYQTIVEAQPTPTPFPLIKNEHLSVSISDARDKATPGQEVNYRITVRNGLHQDIRNALIRVDIPKFYIPDGTDPEASRVDPQTRTIEWGFREISAGAEISFEIIGHIEERAPDGAELVAAALLNGDGVHQRDSDITIISNPVAASTPIARRPAIAGDSIEVDVVERAAIDVAPTAATGPGSLMALFAAALSAISAGNLVRIIQQ